MRLLYFMCLIFVLAVTGCSNPKKQIDSNKLDKNKYVYSEFKQPILEVNPDTLIATINDIAKSSHPFGTDEEKRVANYLKEKLVSFGYDVTYQDFEVFDLGENPRSVLFEPDIDDFLNINPTSSTISKGIARNVVAKQECFDSGKNTLYITCHYDTTKRTTGVYDNSTGVSSVLEIARVLQNYDSDINLIFVFFSAEEYNRVGSRYYLSQLSPEEKGNIVGAINIDMVGCSGFEYKDFPTIGDIEILLSPFVEKDALEISFNDVFNSKYDVNNNLGGMSDDLSFARLGIPTISFADKNFGTGFEIEVEDFKTQVAPVNKDKISELCEDICQFISGFDINKFKEL